MAIDLELHLVDLPYADLRIADPERRARLVAGLTRDGQQQPVLVVAASERFVLIDGYRRVTALRELGRDVVTALVLPLSEASALMFARRLQTDRHRTALEDGWLLRELIEHWGMFQRDLAKQLDRSPSWISRRLALVRQLPDSIQGAIRMGRIPANAAEKCLVPLARANRDHAERLVRNLDDARPTVRQIGRLYTAWRAGDPSTRERIVDHPWLFLKADDEITRVDPPVDDDGMALVRAIEAIAGTCHRARKHLRDGRTHRLDPAARSAVGLAWDEAHQIFGAMERLIREEGLDARRGHTHSSPAAVEGGAQPAGHRESARHIEGSGP